jgi:hypothetical protein
MTLRGRVENGVVVFPNGSAPLPDGTLVEVKAVPEVAGPAAASPSTGPPYYVSEKQKESLLGLIGLWKTEHPPSDEEVEGIIEEARMKKYG